MMPALGLAGQAGTVLLALIFLRAAWHKAADLPRADATAAAYDLLPAGLVRVAVRGLLAAEVAVAAGLIPPATRPAAALLGGAILLVYAGAMGLALLSGRDRIDCGCGGAPNLVSWLLVARNIALTGVAALTLMPASEGGIAEAAVAILAGLTAWAMLGTAETLGANHRFAPETDRRK